MKEQTIIFEFQKLGALVRDAETKLTLLANQLLNMSVNYSVLIKCLEKDGLISPEKFKAAAEAMQKVSTETVPADPREPLEVVEPNKEGVNEPSGGTA